MVMKRSMGALVALLLVAAVGCSSSKDGDESASTTDVAVSGETLPYGISTTSSTLATSETAPPPFTEDDTPVVRAPNVDVFCASFGEVQDLTNTFGSLDFTNGLGIMSAPAQARAAAHKMRESTPDEIQESVDAYAT